MHHLKLTLHINRRQLRRIAQRRLIHVLKLGGLGADEELLFSIIRNSGYANDLIIRLLLLNLHVPIFIFLSHLHCVPILCVRLVLDCALSSWCHRKQ